MINFGQVAQEPNQAKATRPDFDADEVDGNHYPMEESESGTFLKELGDLGAYIEGVMPLMHLSPAPSWREHVPFW